MSQAQAPETNLSTTPKVDMLEKLLDVFTPAQLEILVARCQGMAAQGWGDVTVRFENGKPKFVVWSESQRLP
jgi:hypothetical protein